MGQKPPPTLQELALLQCIKNASHITDIGDTPYRIVKPLLAKFSVDQLAAIESHCPRIAEQDDELWSEHISRVFRDRKLPKRNFRATYFAYCRDKEAQLGAARERLKLKQEQYNEQKRATSIVALSETPVHIRPMAPGQTAFRSRGMQSVARRMHTQTQLRRPQRPQMLVRPDPYGGRNLGWSAPTSPQGTYPGGSPPGADSPPPVASPPALRPGSPLASSPPPTDPMRSVSPTKRSANTAGSLAKRKRVSSVFMPRK